MNLESGERFKIDQLKHNRSSYAGTCWYDFSNKRLGFEKTGLSSCLDSSFSTVLDFEPRQVVRLKEIAHMRDHLDSKKK